MCIPFTSYTITKNENRCVRIWRDNIMAKYKAIYTFEYKQIYIIISENGKDEKKRNDNNVFFNIKMSYSFFTGRQNFNKMLWYLACNYSF